MQSVQFLLFVNLSTLSVSSIKMPLLLPARVLHLCHFLSQNLVSQTLLPWQQMTKSREHVFTRESGYAWWMVTGFEDGVFSVISQRENCL